MVTCVLPVPGRLCSNSVRLELNFALCNWGIDSGTYVSELQGLSGLTWVLPVNSPANLVRTTSRVDIGSLTSDCLAIGYGHVSCMIAMPIHHRGRHLQLMHIQST